MGGLFVPIHGCPKEMKFLRVWKIRGEYCSESPAAVERQMVTSVF